MIYYNSFLYSYMSFLHVTWLRKLLKFHSVTSKKTLTIKLGGNTFKNEMVAYLHMKWPNEAKVGKATVPKSCFDERYPSQQVSWFLIIWYPKKSKKHMQLLQKLLDINRKIQKWYICSLGSNFIGSLLHSEIN